MKRAWLSEVRSPLAQAAAEGLRALGWQVESGAGRLPRSLGAGVRVKFAAGSAMPAMGQDGQSPVVLVTQAPDRMGLLDLSLHVRTLAVAAAPQVRVNGVAVADGWADKLAGIIDWLAGADMVTGQLILLSEEPGPAIPF